MMDSSVSSSPRRRKSRKSWNDNSPVANADIAREETLLLTHFTKKPTISFGKVKVGKTIHRKLLVTNPHEFDQFVHVEKFPHDEHFEMELMDFEVPAESTLSLNISWTPEREGGCRQMILFFIDESYRLQAVLYGTAVVPRQKKVAVRGIMSCVKTPFSVLHTPNLTNIKSYNSTEIQYKTVSSKRTQSKTISNRENTVPVSTKMVTKKRISPNQCTVKNYSCKKNDSVSCKNVTTNLELKTECSVQEISSISKNVSCVPYEDSPENKTIEIDNAVEVLTCVRNVTVESAENANEYQHSYVTTKRQKQMADEVTGPSFCKQSPRRETYLVKKQKRRSWKNKLKKSPTSSGSLPVVTSFSPPQLSPPYHVYDNSVKNTTLSINSVSPIQTNFLLTSSPIESHHQTSACPNRSNLLLPGSDFQDVHQREDKEDNTKLEMLSQLGHPSESNLIEKQQASPKSDNGLSSDSLNSRYSSPNSEIIYDLHQTPMISVEDTSISRRSTHVIKEPKIICKAGVLKKKSLFCWEKMPTSVQKVPVNCKVIRANATPRNDRVSLSSKVRTAKRVTQSTEKAPCEKEKTQMKRRSVLSPKKPAVAQSRLILGKREKTVIPKHPMPFASKNIYYDERWMQKQEWSFTHWFNYILTPVEEYKIRKCVKVDAKSLLFSTKQEARLAPSKEVLSFEAYAARKRLNRLRKLACKMFQTEDIVKVVRRLEVEIDSQRLVMRKDRPVHADIGLKQMILNWILSYNSLWLRIGLEMVFGEILLIDSNTDFLGISRFIVTRLLGNPDIANRYAHPTVPHLYREGYQDALSKHTLKKYLILVFFLDYAKRKRLIEHDPCLFCKDAEIKASKDLLYNIARIFLKGEGDVARHLSYFGYTVSYVQTPLHEFDYAVSNLAVDLRDGIRLTRVIEILTGKWELTDSLRAPAISRLQKIHNVNKVLKALLNNGMDLSLAKGSICAKDIVDGHREKTLTLLWRIVTGFQVDILLDINELRDEVHFLKRCLEKKRSVRKLAGVEDYSIKRNSVEGLLKPENEKHQLLFEWCQAVSAHYGLQIENFTVSFSDGRVLCYLIHHYYPGLLPLSEIKRDTTVTYINECENQQQDSDQSLDELTFSTRFSPKTGKPKIYEALLANEAENFKLIAKKVSAIGGVPAMLRHSDMSNTIPDEKVVITYITYLAIRLLEIRHEARAAIVIQMAWRKYLWRKKQRLQRMKSKSAVVTQWQCNTINKIQVLSPQVGSYDKTSSLVEHSNKNLALSPFQCDQKHNNTEHSYLPKCNLDTIAEVSCLDLVSDGNNYQRDAETNNSPLNLVIRKVNDSNDLGQQKQENRNAREGCISLKTSKLNKTIEFEHEDFNNPLNGTFEINNNNKPHHSRLLNQTIDIDNGVQSNICSVEKSGDEIVTEYIGVQAISKQQSVCSPNKYLEHNQNLNDGTPDRNIDLNDKANINESEANSTTEIRSRLETSTLNELEHLSTLDDSGKFLKRAKINKVHCDLKKDTTNEHCDQPDAYAENCGQLDDPTDGHCDLQNNLDCYHEHNLQNDSTDSHRGLLDDSTNSHRDLLDDSTDGHRDLQNDSTDCNRVLQNDSTDGDHVLLQTASTDSDHVLLQNDYTDGNHVLQNDSAVGDHVLRNDSAVGDHVLQNDSTDGDRVLLQNDSADGNRVLLQNDSAFGDHVLRNDSAVGDHVLQNDSTDGDHVLRNDSAVGDHVLRNDSTDGDRVLLQNDSADGDCVRLQNDSTVGDRVLQNDSTDGDRVLLQNDSADGNRVLLQNDSADGNCVLLQCDSADGNCVPLQNDSADGDHVPLQNDCADGDRVLLLNDSTDGDRGLQNGSTDGHHDLSADCPADGHCDLQDEFSHCDQDFSMVSNGDDQKGSSASSTANIITDANNSRIVDYERLSSSKYDSKHLSQIECNESDSADGTQVLNSSKINTSLQPHSDMDFEEKSLILQNQIDAGDSRPNILDVSRGVLEQQCAIVIQRWYRNRQESYRVASDYQRMKSAVIVLQSFYRMYSQQRKYHKQLEAIRVLQAAVRMHQERQNYRSLCRSTTQIQRWYRGIILCRKQRNKFLKEKQACIQIQSMWRGVMQRQLLKNQMAAAVVIQSSFRKHYCQSRYLKLLSSVILIQKLYRSKLESRKLRMQFLQELREKQLQEEKRQNNAAQLIQATWKCYVAQKEFSKLKTATCVLQQYMSAYLIGKRVRHDFIAQKNAAIKIQSNLRGFIARRRYNNIIAFVTLIQALFRGSQVRRELQLKCHSAVIIQCHWRAYLAKTKFQAEKRTIIRMQALVRAKQQQKKYLNCKNAAIVIQQWYRSISQMRQCHKDYLELKKYTKILQARFRALRSMKICRQQFLQKRIAVTTIQAHVRQFLTRQKFCKQKESVVLLQNWFRACKVAKSDRAYYLSLKTYTIKMQSHVRSWQQQKKFLELKDSALKIQNWYRAVILMRSDHQRYIEYRMAVIKIQSVYRCYREQKKFNKQKQCAVKLQEWWRATSSMRAERKSYLSKQVAIRVIQQWFQSLIAMKLAREDYLKVRASVITIQSHLRRTIQERHFKRTKSSVIKIQQWYRACIQMEIERKNYCSLKTSTVFLQSIVRMKLERRCFLTQRSSAIKIQRWYRILESRRQLKETIARRHAAATFIQNWFKRAIAAKKARSIFNLNCDCCTAASLMLIKVPAEYWLLKTRTKKLNAVCTVQKYCRRWLHRRHQAATVIQSFIRGWLVRKCLAKQTAAAIVIQTNIRAFYARRLFERKKSAILTIERYLQQYLKRRDHAAQLVQRIMRGWIVRKRVKKLHHNATLIQSCWRGYKVRCQSKQTITKLRQRLLAVTKEATEDKKLISRFAEGFDQLMKFKQLSDVLHALVNLEAASRLSPVCCLQLARENAIPVIYNIVKGCNRSVPHMELIKYSIQIFLNLAKYAPTIESVYHSRPDAIDILLNVMMVFREKGLVFSKSCILLGSIALDLKEKGRMDELLSRQQFVEKILSLYKLTVRKYKQEETRIVTRARLVAAKDACPFYENTVLSKIGPDWLLGKKKLQEFEEPLKAMTYLIYCLGLQDKLPKQLPKNLKM